jgi:hypothetical protein
MNPRETIKLMAILAAEYGDKFQITEARTDLWVEMLADLPYPVAETAVYKILSSSPFPPTISDIRKKALPDEVDAAEAWGEVIKAVRYHGIYGEKEAMESLTPRTRKVVTWMGWREICMSEEVGVTRGQFLKMYGQVQERDKQDALLPEGLKKLVSGMKQIGGGRT